MGLSGLRRTRLRQLLQDFGSGNPCSGQRVETDRSIVGAASELIGCFAEEAPRVLRLENRVLTKLGLDSNTDLGRYALEYLLITSPLRRLAMGCRDANPSPTGSGFHRHWWEPIPYKLWITRRGQPDPFLTTPGAGPPFKLMLPRTIIGHPMVCMRRSLRGLAPGRKGIDGDKLCVQHEEKVPHFFREVD